LTRALWATFFTTAAMVAIALGIALGVGAPDQGRSSARPRELSGCWELVQGRSPSRPRSKPACRARPRRRRPFEEPTDAGTAGLVALESSLRFGASTAGDFYAQVRPRLVSLTGSCLARQGVALSDRERSVQLLGADAYALVDPDGAPPEDRFKPGVPLSRVHLLLDRLEALGSDR